MMEKLYYISQGKTTEEHLQNIDKVCSCGVKLVQLRMKNVTDAIYLETAIKAKSICMKNDALLVVNDNLFVAVESEADGLHLGKNDMPPQDARQQFKGLIGGTANTLSDCEKLAKLGVDYIGLGPFRYTETKQNLSPILGIKGVQKVVNNFTKSSLPIYVIGGIVASDFHPIFETGVHGIAVSGMLTQMKPLAIKTVLEKLKNKKYE